MRASLSIAAACLVFLGPTVSAHHSHNAYEVTAWSALEGTVSEIHWILPHAWVYIDVTDAKGASTTWALEAAGPAAIMQNGVKREDVRVGDRIKVRCHLLRDGTPGCLLGFITPDHGDKARGHGIEREWD